MDRIVLPGGYARTDGTIIADDIVDLFDGSLDARLDVDEFGNTVAAGERAWTGTSASGGLATPNCNQWVSQTAGQTGRYGRTDSTTGNWSSAGTATCDTQYHLYCFEH